MPFEEWRELRLVKDPDFDPTLWFVVRDGDEIAAVMRNEPDRSGAGFVGAIGVRKPWRKRGIALALLYHAFGEFYRRGKRRVALGVDAENPTGATRLYERAGMQVAFEAVALGPDYECHSCGRTFHSGLVRVPQAWGDSGEAMAEAAWLELPYPETSIIEAESHEAAAKSFEDHPHLQIPQSSIEVMEIRPMGGM